MSHGIQFGRKIVASCAVLLFISNSIHLKIPFDNEFRLIYRQREIVTTIGHMAFNSAGK